MNDVTVVECGAYFAAPLVGKHLQSLGATVHAIVRPQHARGAQEETQHHPEAAKCLREGKHVHILDLKASGKDRAVARELIAAADIVIVGFAPDVAKRLHIDAQSCHAIKPSVIHVSLPGFAASDDAEGMVHGPAYEATILAASGIFRDMGINRQLQGCVASYSPLPLASAYASVLAALAIVAALVARARGHPSASEGVALEVPLASALLEMLIHNSLQLEGGGLPEAYLSRRQRALSAGSGGSGGSGAEPPLDYFDVLELTDPFYTHYTCADGRPFYLVAPCHRDHQLRALRVLGLREDVERLRLPHAQTYAEGPAAERHGLGAGQVGDAWAQAVRRLMRRAFLRQTADEWERRLGAAGVPGAAHRTSAEWAVSSHARKSGLMEADAEGRVRPGPMAWVETHDLGALTDGNAVSAAPEAPSAQASDGGNEGDQNEGGTVGRTGGWLDGIVIIDCANVIAGPTIGSMLARFGATVTKVDAPTPSYAPETTVLYGLAANMGKRSVLLDAKTADGRAALAALCRRADAVVVNATEESAARLGLSPEEVWKLTTAGGDRRAGDTDAVLTRFDAYGGPRGGGERASHLGYDDNLQAALGILERFGGGMGRVEEHAHVGTIDVVAGAAGALATAAALLQREGRRRARVAAVAAAGSGALSTPSPPPPPPATLVARASLASVGQIVQYPFLCGLPAVLTEEARRAMTRLGPQCKGEHMLLRCYEAADGEWFLLCARLARHLPTGTTTVEGGVDGGAASTTAPCQDKILELLCQCHPLIAQRLRGDPRLITTLAAQFMRSAQGRAEYQLLVAVDLQQDGGQLQ